MDVKSLSSSHSVEDAIQYQCTQSMGPPTLRPYRALIVNPILCSSSFPVSKEDLIAAVCQFVVRDCPIFQAASSGLDR
jgi:hypothetical protein